VSGIRTALEWAASGDDMPTQRFSWSSLRGIPGDRADLVSALPDFGLSLLCLVTWIRPYTFGERIVSNLGTALALEFIAVHASVCTGLFAFRDLSRSRRALGVLLIGVFYVLFLGGSLFFISGYSLSATGRALTSSGLLPAVFGLTLNRMLGVLLGQAPAGKEKRFVALRWAAGAASYVLLMMLTAMLPLPALGITPDVVLAQHFEGSGQWVEEPQHALAFGFLYFLVQGFISLCLGDLLERQDREPASV
jgi:hypothetical protein